MPPASANPELSPEEYDRLSEARMVVCVGLDPTWPVGRRTPPPRLLRVTPAVLDVIDAIWSTWSRLALHPADGGLVQEHDAFFAELISKHQQRCNDAPRTR